MSILGKTWQVKNTDSESSLLKKLLTNRGLTTDEEMQFFFHPSAERDFHDPFLMEDMAHAVARIVQAIEKKERIIVFGDYDVDGITGSAILLRTFAKLGANASYRLPHRIEDGYGLREKFMHEFAKLDVKLVITVDNGISAATEVAIGNELGIDTIITDHHTVPNVLPKAYALLHPKLPNSGYPFTELTGAGVALKLAAALVTTIMTDKKEAEEHIQKLLDLACMGTISDLGQMRGENRYIVKEGLRVLENTRWPGLSRLKHSAGIRNRRLNTYDIGFLLGPRINAAGRISHPSHALKLLISDAAHTEELAKTLEQLNRQRQDMTQEIFKIALEIAGMQAKDPAIVIGDRRFHGGIIGLIAAKLSEKYSRPAIVMEERDDVFVGSCRSVPGVNIVAALQTQAHLLPHFGGHAAAAGFDLPKKHFKEFSKNIKEHIRTQTKPTHDANALIVDSKIEHADITPKTLEMLRWFEPFGVDNEQPRFLCKKMPILEVGTVGSEKSHLKIKTRFNGMTMDAMGFRFGDAVRVIRGMREIDVVCELEENEWNGTKKLQLKLVDIAVTATNDAHAARFL